MKPGIDYIGITTPFYCNDGKGNFLFHKRSKNCRDEQGKWDCGGGQVEFGETFEEAVLREIKEEFNCVGTIQESLPVHTIFRTHEGKPTHWVAISFFVLVNREDVTVMEPHKVDDIGWFRLDNLPSPLHSGFAHTFKTYHTYFEKYIV